jgi:hypothetical protein
MMSRPNISILLNQATGKAYFSRIDFIDWLEELRTNEEYGDYESIYRFISQSMTELGEPKPPEEFEGKLCFATADFKFGAEIIRVETVCDPEQGGHFYLDEFLAALSKLQDWYHLQIEENKDYDARRRLQLHNAVSLGIGNIVRGLKLREKE